MNKNVCEHSLAANLMPVCCHLLETEALAYVDQVQDVFLETATTVADAGLMDDIMNERRTTAMSSETPSEGSDVHEIQYT
jgi:hypothetical protein